MDRQKIETIRFSILVPVYQVEDYLEECIQSVLDQTYHNWELILVDDGSRDRSGEICDCYAEKYVNIHSYHKENGGQLHTRLYALEQATGEFCVFLDSDDTLKKHTLETIFKTIEKYDCDCVIYGMERVLAGQVFEKSARETECCIKEKRKLYQKIFSPGAEYNTLSRKAVKRTVFQGLDYSPYYHITMGEDLLQSLEILEFSKSVAFIDDRLYKYRLRSGSVTETLTEKNYKGYMEVLREVLTFLQRQGIFTEQDYVVYRSSCLIFVCSYLYAICLFQIPFREKKKLFCQLKESAYYQDFLMAGPYDHRRLGCKYKAILALYYKGYYRTLVASISVYKALRTKTRKIKIMVRNRK